MIFPEHWSIILLRISYLGGPAPIKSTSASADGLGIRGQGRPKYNIHGIARWLNAPRNSVLRWTLRPSLGIYVLGGSG